MREEYVAALDAYLKPVPTRLSTRFGLKLLEKPAAIQATGIRKEQSAF